MVRWYYRSVFDELEDLRKYLEALDRQIYETNPAALLPAAGGSARVMLPVRPTTFHVQVSGSDDEVVITAETMAGITKKGIALDLIDPRTLEITCARTDERSDENGGYYSHECTSASITRVVSLPEPATGEGASATFKDGVLEVRLKKIAKESRGKIPVD
ncbi:Hsp20/alpha crystallin family protein [Methanoregula sp. UBA64]|jgi:HSP20 family protein|uniref:Hsp20/alpha crystallin family protein n=1 Tax=Methanoregula sp. UBA64 TaxID=1915554 RepID=UPI0025FF2B19|nr:Hsp20/alpha crystallin family protein [Methanoregula sp. UBA64]